MRHILYKLFFGKPEYNKRVKEGAYYAYGVNLKRIWNNERHHDVGFEKILRLFLVAIQIIFPGIHVRQFFGKKGTIARNVAIECYVLFKTILPFFFLMSGLYQYNGIILLSAYLMTESVFYVSSLIFVSDIFVMPRSYRRNILMLFFNYMEISLCFAVIYAGLHLLGGQVHTKVDYIYFSIVTSTTIGYGDIHPVTDLGKIFVCIQAFLVLAFILLFLNFFGSKVETIHRSED